MCRLFGGSLADGLRPIDHLQKALHPDDKGNVWAALTGDSEAIPLQQFGFRIFRHGDELTICMRFLGMFAHEMVKHN